jgi:hypothetical protein
LALASTSLASATLLSISRLLDLRAGGAPVPLLERLELTWATRHGVLASVDVRSELGPLAQLLYAPFAFPPLEWAVVGTTVTTLALVTALAWRWARPAASWRAALACSVVWIASLDDLDALATLAILLALDTLAGSTLSGRRRGGMAGLWILGACLVTPLALAPGLVALGVGALGRAGAERRWRPVAIEALGSAALVLAGMAGMALVAPHYFDAVTVRPRMALESAAMAILFLATAAIAGGRAIARRDAPGAVALAGASALAALGMLGWRFTGDSSALVFPLGATLLRVWLGGRPVLAPRFVPASLLAVAVLGWMAVRAGPYAPSRFARLRAPSLEDPIGTETSAVRARVARIRAEEPDACFVWGSRDRVMRARVDAFGPLDPMIASRGGARLGEAIRGERCGWAVIEAQPAWADPDASAILTSEERIAIARDYEPIERVGLWHWLARRRASPAPNGARALGLTPVVLTLGPDEAARVELLEPIAPGAIVALRMSVHGYPGRIPRLTAQAIGDEGPVGPVVELGSLPRGEPLWARAPVGHDPRDVWQLDGAPEGDPALAVELRSDASPLDGPVRLEIDALLALPPRRVELPEDDACVSERSLLDARWIASDPTRARRTDDAIEILATRSPGASVAGLRFHPCPDQCLYVAVGDVDAPSMRARVRLDDRLVSDRNLRPVFPGPLALPLDGRETTLSFEVSDVDAPSAALTLVGPRLTRCRGILELMNLAHDGQLLRYPEGAPVEVIGDEIRFPLRPNRLPPASVSFTLPESLRGTSPCMGLDYRVEGEPGTRIAVRVGLVRGRRSRWLARYVVEPNGALESLRDIPVDLAADEELPQISLSAGPIDGEGGHVTFFRPRLYECGHEGRWPFGEP